MKISLNWLKNYVTPGIAVEKLLDKLTMAGLEVEKFYSSGGDTIFEMEITPNRADCLSFVGVARETAVILNKPLKTPKIKKVGYTAEKCSITVEDKNDCPQYIGTLIEKACVGASPKWLKQNLESIGLRPVNNIVDITNFCLMELGQPLHAFDYDKLAGGKIIVRRAKKGERLLTIDDSEINLDPSMLVIADEKGPVAIAGIMGGKGTEVTAKTKNILLESAAFDPVLIRRTARKIALTSDSSYRFERGIDRDLVEKGSDRAVGLILENAEGKVTQRTNVSTPKKRKTIKEIAVSVEEINRSLGAQISSAKVKQILKGLGCSFGSEAKSVLKILPPAFRPDIKQKVDIVEEVARVVGYDRLPLSLPRISAVNVQEDPNRKKREKIKETFFVQGYTEAITFSMINSSFLGKSKQADAKGIRIRNPLSLDQEIMRPTMLPSMLNIVSTNLNRGQKDIRFFEIGKIYSGVKETEVVSFVATGAKINDWREPKTPPISFFDVKGAIECFLKRVEIDPKNVSFLPSTESYYEEGEQISILYKGKEIGNFGKIDEEVLGNWQIKKDNIYYGQIAVEEIYHQAGGTSKYHPLIEYPSVVRDVSLAVKKEVSFAEVRQVAEGQKINILGGITFNEEYLGDKIDQDQRGLIFSIMYQSSERTLREEEVTQAHEQICQALVERLGAVRR